MPPNTENSNPTKLSSDGRKNSSDIQSLKKILLPMHSWDITGEFAPGKQKDKPKGRKNGN